MKNLFSRKLLQIILGIVCLTILTSRLQINPTTAELARSADSFIDSIGVAVHLTYLDTAYEQYEGVIEPRLKELGIRHIRGDSPSVDDKLAQAKFNDLGKIGIKSTLIMDPRWVKSGSEVVQLTKSVIDAIEGLEGPNEWDGQPDAYYQGENFPEGVRNYQAEMYAALKADPDTAHIPVLSPSISFPQNAARLGQVDCDLGNMHSYSFSPWGMPAGGLETRWIPSTKIVCRDKPIVATETGYHNAVNQPERPGISERAASKYLLRLFLEYFNRGIERTYSYELLDLHANPEKDYSQYNYGLLHYDGSPKPDFIALRNVIALLKDSDNNIKQPFLTNTLDYQIRGKESNTNNIHHTLLQKRNHKFYLLLWQEVPSFDLSERIDIKVKNQPLRVVLNVPTKTVNVYQPINTIKPIKQYTNHQEFTVYVSDHPLIIEISPV